ncbi:DUF3316 domain-containing protein [Leucothrix sargassi]|nr:DUF3316 domain-containing protein [Leucothrix sargassi]
MKTLVAMIASSIFIVNAANASYFEETSHDTLRTELSSSKEAAYQAGLDKLNDLKSSSSRDLYNKVGLFASDIKSDTVRLNDGAYVTVQERALPNGQKAYVGVVNVDVSYETHDSDN